MVQIRRKQERSFWAGAAISSIPDMALAWIAAAYFGVGVLGFFAMYIGLQCLYFVLWLKRVGWAWLVYSLYSRQKLIEHLENFLYQQRFPRPPEFIANIEDYFAEIAENNKVPPQTRVKAASELGTLAGIKAAGNYLYSMQLSIAYEHALEKYAKRFPPHVDDANADY